MRPSTPMPPSVTRHAREPETDRVGPDRRAPVEPAAAAGGRGRAPWARRATSSRPPPGTSPTRPGLSSTAVASASPARTAPVITGPASAAARDRSSCARAGEERERRAQQRRDHPDPVHAPGRGDAMPRAWSWFGRSIVQTSMQSWDRPPSTSRRPNCSSAGCRRRSRRSRRRGAVPRRRAVGAGHPVGPRRRRLGDLEVDDAGLSVTPAAGKKRPTSGYACRCPTSGSALGTPNPDLPGDPAPRALVPPRGVLLAPAEQHQSGAAALRANAGVRDRGEAAAALGARRGIRQGRRQRRPAPPPVRLEGAAFEGIRGGTIPPMQPLPRRAAEAQRGSRPGDAATAARRQLARARR